MKALILKEWRENLKWVPLPGLVILLVFLIDKPDQPMPAATDAYYLCLTAVVFGAALGFLQIFFEAHGDKRSLLLHRPISRSRIFLAKALAGVGLYALALGIPFVFLETWLATPGRVPAPYHWRTSLPWLADILSGLVFYFAGMLTAQRAARWYGSRVLPLVAAFSCSCLVWALPEFWQALLGIGIAGLLVGVAAWGSFLTGGAYAPQPLFTRAALAMTFLAGLLVVSVMGKQMIGEWFEPGMLYQVDVDYQGRVLFSTHKMAGGEIAVTNLNGQAKNDLIGGGWRAEGTILETPVHWGYRHNSRFYVECGNGSKPGNERWYYDQTQGRLFGYDKYYRQLLGSIGPDGFTPAGQQSAERFRGKLRYRTNRGQAMESEYLAFPGGVYAVDFARRTIRTLFTPAAGETVTFAVRWRERVVVCTDRSFHVLTKESAPLVSVPRVFDFEKYGNVIIGRLENPGRYYVWYELSYWVREPEEYKSEPSHLLEYDAAGRELARRTVPPFPFPAASYAEALFGLVTPMTEAATLVGVSQNLRSKERSKGSTQKSSLLDYLDGIQSFIPGTSPTVVQSAAKATPTGLIAGYIALILLSAAASALVCFLLARLSAFSRARSIGWALVGFLFGWVGLVLLLVVQEWPARIACPKCRELRVVTRDTCEHCGAFMPRPHRTAPRSLSLAPPYNTSR